MTKGIEDTLGLRSMEDALKAMNQDAAADDEFADYDPYSLPDGLDQGLAQFEESANELLAVERREMGLDTEEKLDDIYGILMQKAETMAQLALEVEPARAARAFEVMNQIIKNAMDAATTKRDLQLKHMKHILDQQKFEFDKNNTDSSSSGMTAEIVAVSTTADLVRSFKKAMEEAPSAEASDKPSD